MKVFRTIHEFKRVRSQWRAEGKTVGLVPTMGALHEGHLSLVRQAKGQTDLVAVSIFVNPAQFGPHEDFQKYPRRFQQDLELLAREKVDAVFAPDAAELYPAGFKTYVMSEELGEKLCGLSRPGHFRGVATIVMKLFGIVQPNIAFFGQKDAQQLLLIRQMVKDLNLDLQIVGCPIVREPDGLAMSSRNRYLTPEERQASLVLHRCLEWAKREVDQGKNSTDGVLEGIRKMVSAEPLARLDYAELVDPDDLSPRANISGHETLLALAVYIGKTRLIDNCLIPPL
jgi:pantoate--beta-alanine ligase